MESLLDLLSIEKNDVISIVGAGGKTTLMYKIAREKSNKFSIVVSTTTKIFIPPKNICKNLIIGDIKEKKFDEFVTWGKEIKNKKIISISECDIEILKKKFDIIILESDGSKEKPIKGYKNTEPCISKYTTKAIAVIDINTINKKINSDNVHNIKEFLQLTNKKNNDKIDIEDYIKLIKSDKGFFKNYNGKKYIYINKVSKDKEEIAIKMKSYIEMYCHVKVLIGEYIDKSISAIVLASGLSRRMGKINKLLLPYNGEKILERTVGILSKIENINEIVLVTQRNIIKSIKVSNKVKVIINNNPEIGISKSIKIGVENSYFKNFMFFVGDEPGINREIIEKLIYRFDNESITLPTENDKFKNPVIFPEKYKKRLLSLVGDIGGRQIIKSEKEKIIQVESDNIVDLKDVDTMEEYLEIIKNNIVVVRGGGDIATGSIQKLHRSGFNIVVCEIEKPSAIRRTVAVSEAIYEGHVSIEDIKATHVENNIESIVKAWEEGLIPVIVDPKCDIIDKIKPGIVLDAILAKKNYGTKKDMAPITIALGPGFEAGVDVDYVIETFRGHNLGRIIFKGFAIKNTGIPGAVNGFTKERVIHAKGSGKIKNFSKIGDVVKKDQIIAEIIGIETFKVKSKIDGILRGIIKDGYTVNEGFKIADVDSRLSELNNCFTISDKARNIAGGVLEAILIKRR